METYEQALAWLGTDAQQTDDFIPTLVTVKVEENPSNRELARSAVELIAQHRNSTALRHWLEKGEMPSGEMGIQEAYNLLGVTDPPTATDELILDAFNTTVSVNPERRTELRSALQKVAKIRDSAVLEVGLVDDASNNSGEAATPLNEPRGLRNIGNTCYLNSLLQYFFSILPIREAVEHIDQNKEESLAGTSLVKRVGNENVNSQQVERALQCEPLNNSNFPKLDSNCGVFLTSRGRAWQTLFESRHSTNYLYTA